MTTIEEYFKEFRDEADIRAESDEDYLNAAFFELFVETAEENGDVDALDYSPFRRQGLQIDGYQFEPDAGVLTLAVADFRANRTLQSLNTGEIKQYFRRAENFFGKAHDADSISDMEETSYGYQVAFLIFQNRKQINRVRFLLLSNARLASRLTGLDSREENGCMWSYSVLDFGRYFYIHSSRTGHEPIEIDVKAINDGKGLPALPAHAGSNEYESYLIAMPGTLLAKIYFEYGARLLEQNVRTFLQARGKVNKGIISTIKNRPEMFFAYNNGITATASEITLDMNGKGTSEITGINNLQVVNGGQTTASMLYARDKERCNLDSVYVQMKLSVIDPEFIDEVVPNISRFANTQNKVSEADFFSNHPYHVRVEEFSRRLHAPPREGQFAPSKWFYERARGQYRDRQAYLTDARRKQFQTEFPKDQVITKTDLAKYEVTFDCAPYLVSAGAQKNFLKFAETVAKRWQDNDKQFSEDYYRSIIARAIVFRRVDRMVMRAPWYQGGYKANIVTYSIAWLVHFIRTKLDAELDLEQIWKLQDLPSALMHALETVAERVADEIEETPDTVRNVTEWCKKQACWKAVSDLSIPLKKDIRDCTVSIKEVKERKKDAQKVQAVDNDIMMESMIVRLGDHWKDIVDFALANKCLGAPNVITAVTHVVQGKAPNPRQTKLLAALLERVQEHGYKLPKL